MEVDGYMGRIFDLGHFAAPRHPSTSQGGGWTMFCPSQHYVRESFGLKYLEGGSPCGRSQCVFLDETQNAAEVLCRRAAQGVPGGSSTPEEGVRRLESSEVRVCQQCQQCQRIQQCQRCQKSQRFWTVPVTVSRPTRQEYAPGSTSDPPVSLWGLAGGTTPLGSTPRAPR